MRNSISVGACWVAMAQWPQFRVGRRQQVRIRAVVGPAFSAIVVQTNEERPSTCCCFGWGGVRFSVGLNGRCPAAEPGMQIQIGGNGCRGRGFYDDGRCACVASGWSIFLDAAFGYLRGFLRGL
jgi:hypothetical protein